MSKSRDTVSPSTATPRTAGILLHVSSLPTAYGIGDLGPVARRFVDMLSRAGQTWWQTLPLNPPGAGYSPYQAYSAFAGNPMFISPDDLVAEGLISRSEANAARSRSKKSTRVDFPTVERAKTATLTRAFEHFRAGRAKKLASAFEKFIHNERDWLEDYALFMALRRARPNLAWQQWPGAIVRRERGALKQARSELRDAIDLERFTQFLFFRQLDALRKHLKQRGVKLFGDVPIFVSPDSADVWANQPFFQLDAKTRKPTHVAGVPPDYFSRTGQRWGNPLYNWKAIERDGFRWWIDRARATLRQADLVRIDHFRGFVAHWEVPARAKTAQHGQWMPGPGRKLFDALHRALGDLPFVAEDLGVITPDVDALRHALQLPGMTVLHFAFGSDPGNPFLPTHHARRTIAYTGTHDNDTTVGWFKSLSKDAKKQLRAFAPDVQRDPAGALMRMTLASVADTAILPMQDILRLGRGARMNLPGSATGNWVWALRENQLKANAFNELAEMTRMFDRAAAGMSKSE